LAVVGSELSSLVIELSDFGRANKSEVEGIEKQNNVFA